MEGHPPSRDQGSSPARSDAFSPDLIRTSIYDKYSGSMKITTHLYHISHYKTSSGINWSNRWTFRVFIMNTRFVEGHPPSRDKGSFPAPRSDAFSSTDPPWRQPRGKTIVSLVNSHTNATSKRENLLEIDLVFAPGLPPGWLWDSKKAICSH